MLQACGNSEFENKLDSQLNADLAYMESDECHRLEDSARSEAAQGRYYYTRSGTIFADEYEIFYSTYMKQKYGIEMRGSCVGVTNDCFAWTANDLVEKKFGSDIEARSNDDARALYNDTLNPGLP